jgi:putative dimethyl sulfoxide reductase chaperone
LRRQEQDEANVARTRDAAGPPGGGPAASLADVCAGRAAVYEVLAYGFSEPSAALVGALASGEVVALVRGAVGWLRGGVVVYEPALAILAEAGSQAAAAGSGPALGDLRVEYARLFTGPGRTAVKCYASEYPDASEPGAGRLNGSAADYAEAAYKSEGVSLVTARGDLPDHMTTELEFLYHLCRREEAAWAADDGDEAARLRRSLDAFLRAHAGSWLPRFAASVRALAGMKAYSGMAALLSTHLAVELGDGVRQGPGRQG